MTEEPLEHFAKTFQKIFGDAVYYREISREIIDTLHRKDGRHTATELMVNKIKERHKIYSIRTTAPYPELWVYENGIYTPYGANYIKKACRLMLGDFFTKQIKNEVLGKLSADTLTSAQEFFDEEDIDCIAVENGLVNLRMNTLSEHTPDKIYFSKLPVQYDEEADCPKIKQFFKEVLENGEDDLPLIAEMFGFCLYNKYFLHKAFLLVGEGGNGKSVTFALIKGLLGAENVAGKPLAEISQSGGFHKIDLFKKKANVCGDISDEEIKAVGNFKSMTGEDQITASRKFKDSITFTNFAKMFFSCNKPPKVSDSTAGFWRRWCILQYPYSYRPQRELDKMPAEEKEKYRLANPDLQKELLSKEEMSGLLNWALQGLRRLFRNGEFSESKSIAETTDVWLRLSNSALAFIKDKVVIDYSKGTLIRDIKKAYHKYCIENNLPKEVTKKFNETLKAKTPTAVRQLDSGERYWDCISVEGYELIIHQEELEEVVE